MCTFVSAAPVCIRDRVGKCNVLESFGEKSLTLLLCSLLIAGRKSNRIQVVATHLVETENMNDTQSKISSRPCGSRPGLVTKRL